MYSTNFERSRLVNHAFGGATTSASYTPQANWYLGLSTTTIQQDGTGVTEPDPSTGYERKEIPNTKDYWTVSTTGSLASASAVAFDATEVAMGTIYGAFLSTASSAGSVCYFYNFPTAVSIPVDTVITFEAGKITTTIG